MAHKADRGSLQAYLQLTLIAENAHHALISTKRMENPTTSRLDGGEGGI